MKIILSSFLLFFLLIACNDDDTSGPNGSSTITIAPPKATILIDAKIVFMASVDDLNNKEITWSIEPASGSGTIEVDPNHSNLVIYNAPASVCGCKLIATSVENVDKKGTVDITVVETLPETEVIFEIGNIIAVQSGPQNPTEFSINESRHITFVQNYHYFNQGKLPGTISLEHSDGTKYGPWQCTGLPGQGNVSNAYWVCYPDVTIKAGSYTVIDSDPATWSHNDDSDNRGMTIIEALKK